MTVSCLVVSRLKKLMSMAAAEILLRIVLRAVTTIGDWNSMMIAPSKGGRVQLMIPSVAEK